MWSTQWQADRTTYTLWFAVCTNLCLCEWNAKLSLAPQWNPHLVQALLPPRLQPLPPRLQPLPPRLQPLPPRLQPLPPRLLPQPRNPPQSKDPLQPKDLQQPRDPRQPRRLPQHQLYHSPHRLQHQGPTTPQKPPELLRSVWWFCRDLCSQVSGPCE